LTKPHINTADIHFEHLWHSSIPFIASSTFMHCSLSASLFRTIIIATVRLACLVDEGLACLVWHIKWQKNNSNFSCHPQSGGRAIDNLLIYLHANL
jgi:hypothetical protein